MSKIIIAISLIVAGIGSLLTYSTYQATKVTMLDYLKNEVLQDENINSWKNIHKNIIYKTENNLIWTDPEKLQKWCFSKYKVVYSSVFQKPKVELSKKIKKYCSSPKKQLETKNIQEL